MLAGTLAFAFDWRALFAAGAGVSTPLGALGFLIAAVLAGYAIKTRADAQRLKNLPHRDRAKSLDSYATRYGINLAGIAPGKQHDLVLHEMNLRWRKQISAIFLAAVVFLCCFTMAVLSYQRHISPDPAADQSVIDYMRQIEGLRGEFEARNPGWSAHVRQEGLRLANLIGNVEPDRLRPARKIVQREYRGWALLMVARTFGEETPEGDAQQHRIEYATQAVDELDSGLAMMRDIDMLYKAGKGGQETEKLYGWMMVESLDVERSHYLKAVAFAVIARAGGHHTKDDVKAELAGISATYLSSYPPDNNPDLKWARQ